MIRLSTEEMAKKANDRKKAIKEFITKSSMGEEIRNIPSTYQYLMLKVYTNQATKGECIKAKCLECSCFDRKEVTYCDVTTCPMFNIRPFRIKE